MAPDIGEDGGPLEIVAFRINEQEFCVRTISVREIRGWSQSTPLPNSPPDILGLINLRGTIIPVVSMARKLGMTATDPNPRSAIVVVEVQGKTLGLLVDRLSDIMTVDHSSIQPVPEMSGAYEKSYAQGIIAHSDGMICFLNLEQMFPQAVALAEAA
ncbi:chemotaxis protein CheW [Aurantimonas sp. C2-6-R+9]|uniref:chemotaxis protein CheW n=1 Tax=unclassified Aurantimonas TaxID=2638230 RepID=UPI002E1856D4|nr:MULTISPECIES: chemotaxis protein CheW [unclassified Aurantimonas]MEC5290488.1 chemotaxis protein CheW [Aurantimonas sp. C2-3-R2]MEC5322527.1 chemotaxis protein CheW [Aurantimonas sp. A3-2-R12]MEC5380503.1 chemotaxis protein CheW [Aurantimonas sp. C2-6-R+9]MEC5411549.1 chemotaxis protein CheW [Aurantimonas sp. C2-4-R8]